MRTKIFIATAFLVCFVAHSQIPTGFKNSSLNKLSQITRPKKVTEKGKDPVYITQNLILQNYDNMQIAKTQPKLDTLLNQLYQNSKGTGTIYDPATVTAKMDTINTLKLQIQTLTQHRDSLNQCYVREYVQYNNVFFLNFGAQRSRAFFDILYDNNGKQFKALGNSGLNFGNSTGSIFSELVSGNLGLFRVSLGTMIANSANDTIQNQQQQEAYQKLVSYGGNTVLTFEYPLAYLHSNDNRYNLISRAIAKGTADLPAFGTTTDNWAGSGQIGLDLYADAALDNESLRFFLQYQPKWHLWNR